MHTSPATRRLTAGAGAISAVLALGAISQPAQAKPPVSSATPRVAVAAEVDAPIPELDWESCGEQFECAEPLVPLDYDEPDGATVKLALLRRPADDPDQRIGTLFVNPGGPGGRATTFVPFVAELLGPDIRDRFDIIGIDPRGIGGSTRMRCRSDEPVPPRVTNYVPFTRAEARPLLRDDRYTRAACANGNAIVDHMSTADTARDMDLIRQAVGDEQLTYYGVSYGTVLGATYAAMFPDRVRAVILDSVVDPVAWTTGRPGPGPLLPVTTRMRSGIGSWEALTSAFAECDRVGRARCAIAGHASASWARIVERLKEGPSTTRHFGRVTYSNIIDGTLQALYVADVYPELMRQIGVLDRELSRRPSAKPSLNPVAAFKRSAATTPGPYEAPTPTSRQTARTEQFTASLAGVMCADSVNPDDPLAWLHAGAVADRGGPWFGRLWTWLSSVCARWPGSSDDAFRGPFRVHTSSPVMITANYHDPATPISGAHTVNALLRGSRLLSVNGWGHGSIFQGACVTGRMAHYLLTQDLPVAGLVCPSGKPLYPRVR